MHRPKFRSPPRKRWVQFRKKNWVRACAGSGDTRSWAMKFWRAETRPHRNSGRHITCWF